MYSPSGPRVMLHAYTSALQVHVPINPVQRLRISKIWGFLGELQSHVPARVGTLIEPSHTSSYVLSKSSRKID